MDDLFSRTLTKLWDNNVGSSGVRDSDTAHRQPTASGTWSQPSQPRATNTTPVATIPTTTVSTTTAASYSAATTADYHHTLAAPGFAQPGTSVTTSLGHREQVQAPPQADTTAHAQACSSHWGSGANSVLSLLSKSSLLDFIHNVVLCWYGER